MPVCTCDRVHLGNANVWKIFTDLFDYLPLSVTLTLTLTLTQPLNPNPNPNPNPKP